MRVLKAKSQERAQPGETKTHRHSQRASKSQERAKPGESQQNQRHSQTCRDDGLRVAAEAGRAQGASSGRVEHGETACGSLCHASGTVASNHVDDARNVSDSTHGGCLTQLRVCTTQLMVVV